METENKKVKKQLMTFSLLNDCQTQIADNKEGDVRNKKYVSWGTENNYPNYLYDLYCNVPTLSTIINGICDYVSGDGIEGTMAGKIVNSRGEYTEELVRELAFNIANTGGLAIQVNMQKNMAKVAETFCLPLRYVRTDVNAQSFTYCEGFGERYKKKKEIVFPKFTKAFKNAEMVYYDKNAGTDIYPVPMYASALNCCEIEKQINNYHLSAINNGFAGNYVINFNNGEPTEEEKKEIERRMNDKFAGANNAGKMVFAWNDNKENAITVEKLEVEDYGEKYNSLVKRVEQQIYSCFRATPNLFGIATESNGFNSEEYSSAFKLFNKTIISPIQRRIERALNDIYGEGSVHIIPFNIDFNNE